MQQSSRIVKRCALTTLALALLCLALPGGALADKKPRPAYWGAWIGPQLTGAQPPWDMSAVTELARLTGKGMSIVEFSVPFADCAQQPCDFYKFPHNPMGNVRSYGAIPFLSWSSFATSGEGHESAFQLNDIVAGHYDRYILQFASEAAAWGHPFFLRFNWEMNGSWFPWAEGVNGNRRGEYVAAWRRVHDIFASVGATNVTWVWCPYAAPQKRFQGIRHLYPGNAYVDWTCMDGYNWARNSVNPVPWMSFGKIFDKTYRQIVKRIAPRKPMLLAELASNGPPRAKAAWIRNMFRLIRTRYRRIRGLIWFNQIDRGVEWPLEGSPLVTRAFGQGIKRGYRPNVYAGTTGSPIRPPQTARR